MNDARLGTIEQIREFLAGTADMTFTIPTDQETLHQFVATVLKRFRYFELSKGAARRSDGLHAAPAPRGRIVVASILLYLRGHRG